MSENNLTKLFSESVSNYGKQRSLGQGKDSSVSSVQSIEYLIPQYLTNLIGIHNATYAIKGSCGVGKWSEIPWITIMNKKITTSVSRGYYLTYLFDSTTEQVYLAFMFAVTDNKELDALIPQAKKIVNEKVLKSNIILENIDNLGKSARAKQYGKATVAYIRYSKSNMPENDVIWIEDLKNMIDIYEHYIQKIIGGNASVEDIKFRFENLQPEQIEEISIPLPILQSINTQDLINHMHLFIESKGFYYPNEEIKNLYLSLRSKPFVIISGISGTGKTKIVQLFAESVGATEENGQFKLIPVRPDWSDSSELLGYLDLKGEFQKGPLTEMIENAMDHPNLPHFALLDEMNLARVEYYFSDVLSVMESRKRDGDQITSSQLLDAKYTGRAVKLPNNLYLVGTVNVDETTHPFSKKVLDRANTIEFNEINLDRFDFLDSHEEVEAQRISNEQLEPCYISLKDVYLTQKLLVEEVSQKLADINRYLEPINAHVGYRVRDEICFYMVHNANAELLEKHEAFDFCVMQKILPRITGSDGRIENLLQNLFTHFTSVPYDVENIALSQVYPRSVKKVAEMLRRYHTDGFTSFWIS